MLLRRPPASHEGEKGSVVLKIDKDAGIRTRNALQLQSICSVPCAPLALSPQWIFLYQRWCPKSLPGAPLRAGDRCVDEDAMVHMFREKQEAGVDELFHFSLTI